MRAVNLIDRLIVRHVVESLAKAGYSFSIPEDSGNELELTGNVPKTLQALAGVDDERLYVSIGAKPCGWVYFVFGNDGFNVVSDYTTNLETVLASSFLFSKDLEEGKLELAIRQD